MVEKLAMTEDDTFYKLKKLPLHLMNIKLRQSFNQAHDHLEYDKWIDAKVEFLRINGWTIYEINKANSNC